MIDNGPSLTERQALGNLLRVLQKGSEFNPSWNEYIEEYFSSWEPIFDSDISLSTYYRTLKHFPRNGKREIIRGVLTGWNVHHSDLILYESITTLIYLKVCDVTEYFFLQQFYNFLEYFSDTVESKEQIVVQTKGNSFYTLRFLKEGEKFEYGDSYGVIDFQMPKIGQKEALYIVPWFSIINKLKGYDEDTTYDEYILSVLMDEFYPLLEKEFVKRGCPWIQSRWEASYGCDKFNRGMVIIMDSLQYIDMNGE